MENYKDEHRAKLSIETYEMYRYIPIYRLRDMLESGMYLPSANQFEDKREGCLPFEAPLNPERLVDALKGSLSLKEKNALAKLSSEYIALVKEMQEDLLISCWYTIRFENYIMWKAYGGQDGAVRIGAKLTELISIFNGIKINECVDFVLSNYVRYRTPIGAYCEDIQSEIFGTPTWRNDGSPISSGPNFQYFISCFFYKHAGFQDEREFRFIVGCNDHRPRSNRIDIKSAISEITLSPYCDEKTVKEVEQLITHYLPSASFNRSYIEPRSNHVYTNT